MSNSPENPEEDVEVPSEGPDVRQLTIHDAYQLGSHITYLRFAGQYGHPVGSVESGGILRSLEDIQNRLIETDTALTVANQIEDFKVRVHNAHESDTAEESIHEDLGDRLNQLGETWGQLLVETLVDERRIKIPSSGFLDLEQLMQHPGHMFGENVWESMDETPKQDIAEACRALPMGCTTASVMVSLRAVEHYLRKWYEHEAGEELERGTWGSVLDYLMNRYVAEEDANGPILQQLSSVPSVLSHLYYLKEKRDQVNHPDESPTDYEAIITLFMVTGTISEVCEVLGIVNQENQSQL